MADAKAGDVGATVSDGDIAPRRRELLRWLAEDARKPDEMGEQWWDEFEAALRERRLKIGDQRDA